MIDPRPADRAFHVADDVHGGAAPQGALPHRSLFVVHAVDVPARGVDADTKRRRWRSNLVFHTWCGRSRPRCSATGCRDHDGVIAGRMGTGPLPRSGSANSVAVHHARELDPLGPAVLLPDRAGGGQPCADRRVTTPVTTSQGRTRGVPRDGGHPGGVRSAAAPSPIGVATGLGAARRRHARRSPVQRRDSRVERQAYLGACLASLAAQDYPGAFEVIVVDNNSTDDTATPGSPRAATNWTCCADCRPPGRSSTTSPTPPAPPHAGWTRAC